MWFSSTLAHQSQHLTLSESRQASEDCLFLFYTCEKMQNFSKVQRGATLVERCVLQTCHIAQVMLVSLFPGLSRNLV